jgi:hypothetical protein
LFLGVEQSKDFLHSEVNLIKTEVLLSYQFHGERHAAQSLHIVRLEAFLALSLNLMVEYLELTAQLGDEFFDIVLRSDV